VATATGAGVELGFRTDGRLAVLLPPLIGLNSVVVVLQWGYLGDYIVGRAAQEPRHHVGAERQRFPPRVRAQPLEDSIGTLHWKSAALVAPADGRRFGWLDDEISDIDRAWVSAHHGRDGLASSCRSELGVTEADVAVVGRWLEAPV
jgi:hypothetical protein